MTEMVGIEQGVWLKNTIEYPGALYQVIARGAFAPLTPHGVKSACPKSLRFGSRHLKYNITRPDLFFGSPFSVHTRMHPAARAQIDVPAAKPDANDHADGAR